MSALAALWAVPWQDVHAGHPTSKPTLITTGDRLVVGRASLPLPPSTPSAVPKVSHSGHRPYLHEDASSVPPVSVHTRVHAALCCKMTSLVDFKIGMSSSSGSRNAQVRSAFAETGHAMRLVEALAAAVSQNEAVLLVGETGTGKTSMVQHLADKVCCRRSRPPNCEAQEVACTLSVYRPLHFSGLLAAQCAALCGHDLT